VTAGGAAPRQAVPATPPPRYWALWQVVVAERDGRIRRAVTISTVVGLLAVFSFGASILPDAATSNVLAAYLVFLLVQGSVLALVLLHLTGGQYRQALIVGEFARRGSYRDWEASTGEEAPPLTPESAARWLARHPNEDELAAQRLHAQINVGDLAGARQTLTRFPRETAEERFGFVTETWFLSFLQGSDAEPMALDGAADEIEDPARRAQALAGIASMRAYLAAVRGGDWIGQMAAPFALVAGRISDDWRVPTVVRAWTMTMAVTSAMLGAALLVSRWLGVWSV
jgi:hypothetical protein